jgi:hypothetical protein
MLPILSELSNVLRHRTQSTRHPLTLMQAAIMKVIRLAVLITGIWSPITRIKQRPRPIRTTGLNLNTRIKNTTQGTLAMLLIQITLAINRIQGTPTIVLIQCTLTIMFIHTGMITVLIQCTRTIMLIHTGMIIVLIPNTPTTFHRQPH